MKKEDRFPLFCLLAVLIVFAIGAINPVYRDVWIAESLLIFLFVPILIITYRKFKFSNTSYVLIAIFSILQILGSHYTYSEVPLGFWLKELLNLSRNHYDRIVHFLWGALLYLPVFEIYSKNILTKSRTFFYYLMPAAILVSLGALFEVGEWIIVRNVGIEEGVSYFGAQGDIWDTQKDTFLQMIGSFITALFYYTKRNKSI